MGGKLLTFTGQGITADATTDPGLAATCQISMVAVTFTADVPSIIPGWQLQVHVSSHGPLEQFVNHP